MVDFIAQYALMCVGSVTVILWRAMDIVPEDEFEYRKFFADPKNYRRFSLLAGIFLGIQTLIHFEGQDIIEAMKSVSVIGAALPALGSGALGFLITWTRFKLKRD